MSLIKWFDDRRKQLQGLYHQINPFDGSRTYDTNQRGVNPGTPNPVRIDDNTPGFQWSNNSLTRGVSRAFDQVNPLDNNRTWQQRTPTDTLSIVQDAKQRMNNPVVGATSRAATSVLAGIGRFGGAGTAQVIGGAYDLLTPGKGRSRLSQWGDQKARELDVIARDHGNTPIYRATQAAGELASMAAVPKAAANIASKAPRVTKPIASAVKAWDSKAVPAIGNVAQKTLTKANMPTLGRVANYGTRHGLTATDLAQDAVMTAKLASQDASRGTAITPGRVATDAAMTLVGNPVAGAVMGGAGRVLRPVAKAADRAASSVRSAMEPRFAGLTRNQVIMDPAKLDVLHEAKAHIIGEYTTNPRDMFTPSVRDKQYVLSGLHKIKDEHGLDFITGSPAERKQRIEQFLERNGEAIPELQKTFESQQVFQNTRAKFGDAIANARDNVRQSFERLRSDERGFIAGPLALDFSDYKKKGMVFDGVDGKPRFEVDDSGAKIKNPEGKTLGEMLDHPKLFENYPDLKDAPIEYDMRGDLGPASAAVQNLPNGKTGILVNPLFANQPDKLKSYLLHETQHLIQKNENFARGTSPETALADFNDSFDKKYGKRLTEIRNEIDDITRGERFKATEAELNKIYGELFSGDVNNPSLNRRAKALEKRIEKENRRIDKLARERNEIESRRITDMEAYERSAGEAEARAVQARMDMPMSERYKAPKKLYHGTRKSFDEFKSSTNKGNYGEDQIPGIYLVGDKDTASMFARDPVYGSARGSVKEIAYKPENPLVGTPNEIAHRYGYKDFTSANKVKIAERAKSDGYDAIIRKKGVNGKDEIIALYPERVKDTVRSTFYDSLDVPKEDLIIRNDGGKAMSVEKDPIESLKQEARKYKSAEEFVEAARTMTSFDRDAARQVFANVKPGDGEQGVINALTDLYNQATQSQPPKSTPVQKQAPQPTKGATSPKTSSARAPSQSQPAGTEPQIQPPSRRSSAPSQVQDTPQVQSAVSSRQSAQSSNSLDASGATSSKAPVIADNSTTSGMDSKEWGSLLRQADEELPRFDAVAGARGTRNADRLADAINTDNKITKAAREAQRTGKELHFYAKNDANGRSVGIEQFDPSTHRIEAGFVVDKKGNVVGNHIKVDETGIQVNVGGDLVNMSRVIGSPDSWRGKYRITETMSRNIDRNAPNKEVARQTKDFLIGSKVKAEANYRVELDAEYKKLGERIKQTNKAKPRGVSKKQWQEDIFDSLDGKLSDADIRAKYGDKAQAILDYKKQTRELYDSLFERINAERVKFGQAPIEKRKDYITHLQELSSDRSFTGEVFNSIRNSFTDEGMQKTRGGVPGDIAGRTENFQPRSAYNRFLQRRTGDKAIKDPFASVQAYLEPALYNIHMTEATVRARAVESAFRTAGLLKNMSVEGANKRLNGLLSAYKGGDNAKLITGFQEYANTLAKKTNRFDRIPIDASDATATALRGWQRLQRIGGRATILGNVSSTLAQPLNQVITLADAGPVNYMKGIASALSGDKAIQKSSFIRARATKAVAPIRSKGQRALDAGGVPLEAVEMASVRNTWHAMHAKAKAAGKQGMEAIKQADYDTERLVAGRGIADRPEAYRSTLSNGLLQYTLEVSAQNKAFWQDLSVSQKATFLVAAAGVNSMYGAITGFEPLPDFLGAALDTGKELVDSEDDRSAGEKVVGGVQRMAGEAVSMNPMYSATANILLSQDQRRGLFGSESDLGRFEGTSAPVQVIRNWNRARESAMDGNFTDARNSLLRTVPFGNQIRKTWTGAEANTAGHAVNRAGKETFETGRNAVEKGKNLLFGPSSTAGDYYDKKPKQSDGTISIGDKTEKDKSGKTVVRDKYDAILDAYSKHKGQVKVGKYDTNELRKANQEIGKEVNDYLRSAGLPEVRTDTNVAKIWARHMKQNYSDLEKATKTREVVRNIYKSRASKDAQTLLGLSDGAIRQAINDGSLTKKTLEEAIALDNFLFDNGLSSSLYIGNTIRGELGIEKKYAKGKGGSGRGGRGKAVTKADLSMFQKAARANAYIKPPSLDAPQVRKVTATPGIAIKRKISTSKAAPKTSVRKGTRLA